VKEWSIIFFYPKSRLSGTVIILELRVGTSDRDTIQHLHERQYYHRLREKGCKRKILLVGINVTTGRDKEYSCCIEEYDESKKRHNNSNNNNNSNSCSSNNNKRKKRRLN